MHVTTAPILLIGGTRGTGLLISRALVERGTPIRVFARDPDRAINELGPTPDIVPGDLTREATLDPAVAGVRHIIFTAGFRSGRPVGPSRIRRTEYEGVVHTLRAASRAGFSGRFLYMNSSGIGARSFWTLALNIYKGNTLVWRQRAEAAIRASGLQYTIIRTGMLTNRTGGVRAIEVTQRALPLSPRYRIARADVAAAFVAAIDHPRVVRSTFEIVWASGPRRKTWDELLDCVAPDDPPY